MRLDLRRHLIARSGSASVSGGQVVLFGKRKLD